VPNIVYLEAPIGEDPDKRDYIVSTSKIERIGYAPKFSLDDGIREHLKGYRMIRDRVYGNV
jgi:nucleoside-diphosphate-sugar epimerase